RSVGAHRRRRRRRRAGWGLVTTPLVIIGAGGHGREALDIVEAVNAADVAAGRAPSFEALGFIAEDADPELLDRRGQRLLGRVAEAGRLVPAGCCAVVAIGPSDVRAAVVGQLAGSGLEPVALVHPRSTFGSDLRLGPGLLAAAGSRITTNVTTGAHTHL